MSGLYPTVLMRVRPPTVVARLAETPHGASVSRGRPPYQGYYCSDRLLDFYVRVPVLTVNLLE